MATLEEFARRRKMMQEQMARALSQPTTIAPGEAPAKAWQPLIGMLGGMIQDKRLAGQEKEAKANYQKTLADALSPVPEVPNSMEGHKGSRGTRPKTITEVSEALLQNPDTADIGLQLRLAQMKNTSKPAEWKLGEVGAGGDQRQSIFYNPADPTKTMPAGQPFKKAGQTINVGGKSDSEYWKERRKQQAEGFRELEKSAESAYKQRQTLSRFIEASKKGIGGGAQPVISGVQNFLASFGYSPESLKDVRVMEQAIGDILGNKMAELGARGLTDKDMQVLREALPRVNTDPASREIIANIMIKASDATLGEYANARAEEARIYPELAAQTPVQAWFKDYQSQMNKPTANTPQQGGLSPEEQAELEALRKQLGR